MASTVEDQKSWTSKHMFARIAPRKVRLIIDLVRGRRCGDAMEQLRFSHQRAARFIEAVLAAAMTSADEAEADMRRLVVKEAKVDGGPYQRRWRPKDRGRAHPIAKRTSHILLTIGEAKGGS